MKLYFSHIGMTIAILAITQATVITKHNQCIAGMGKDVEKLKL